LSVEHQLSMRVFLRQTWASDQFVLLKLNGIYAASFPRINHCYIDSDFVIRYRKPSCTVKWLSCIVPVSDYRTGFLILKYTFSVLKDL